MSEDPSEAATLPYDPDELSVPNDSLGPSGGALEEHEHVQQVDHHINPTFPADPLSSETRFPPQQNQSDQQALCTLASDASNQRGSRGPVQNSYLAAQNYMDRHVENETIDFGLNDRSPTNMSRRSTLTDTQFSSPHSRTLDREYEGSDSSQMPSELQRPMNPANDLGSQDSIKAYDCNEDYNRRLQMDSRNLKRSKSAIEHYGPEAKRNKHNDSRQYSSDLTEFLRVPCKSFFTEKQKALINPRFNMQKYPDKDRPRTFAGSLSATTRILESTTYLETTGSNAVPTSFSTITLEQLRNQYSLSFSSEDAQGSPDSHRNPYVSPQRQYHHNSSEDVSPLRYPSPHHPFSSGSSLGTAAREASTLSISSHGRISNFSDEVNAYKDLHFQGSNQYEELYGVYASSDPGNDYSDLGEFYQDQQLDDPLGRELTPEIEDSSVPRSEAQYDLHASGTSDPNILKKAKMPKSQKSPVAGNSSKSGPTDSAQPEKSETEKQHRGKGRVQAEPRRRSSRIKEHTHSGDFKPSNIKVILSSAIEESKRNRYNTFLDHKGAKAENWEECTVYVSATIEKDTTGSICALITGKDVVDSKWLDDCIQEQAFTDYKCRVFPKAKTNGQGPLKGKKVYFSKDCMFIKKEKRLIAKAVGATALLTKPKAYDAKVIAVIKELGDSQENALRSLGYKPTLLDQFIESLSKSA